MKFLLSADTIAVFEDPDTRKPVALTIPASSVIIVPQAVAPEITTDTTVRIEVHWDEKLGSMFLVDLQTRGQPVGSRQRDTSA